MAVTIYGSARSRTMRVLWVATELELKFEHVAYEHDDPRLKQPEFLALNPLGTIPTISDDGFALSESLAINLYLVEKYGRPETLAMSGPESTATAVRWSLWAQGAIEPWVQRDRAAVELLTPIRGSVDAFVDRSLGLLESALGASPWLSGDEFSMADLNVASILSPSRAGSLDLERFPRTEDWLTACYARPAARKTRRTHAS